MERSRRKAVTTRRRPFNGSYGGWAAPRMPGRMSSTTTSHHEWEKGTDDFRETGLDALMKRL